MAFASASANVRTLLLEAADIAQKTDLSANSTSSSQTQIDSRHLVAALLTAFPKGRQRSGQLQILSDLKLSIEVLKSALIVFVNAHFQSSDDMSQWALILGQSLGVEQNAPVTAPSKEFVPWIAGYVSDVVRREDDALGIDVKLKHNCGSTLAEASQRCLSLTKSDVAGGRLMMTNLSLERAFKVHDLPFVEDHLPILVDDKTTRVERAAALSANFPPVFSNGAIDIDNEQRYWVTDGGAADNRGLEPVLYAARDAVQHRPNGATRLPTLKVVIIDASGTSTGFEQNRGLGSALGAGAHFADQLNNEVASRLIDIYEAANQNEDLHFYYVPMPNMLRTSGSFGTHWMLQKLIKVDNGSKTQTFKGTDVVDALRAAYSGRAATGESAQLAGWIRKSPEFTTWCKDLSQRMTGQPRTLPDCPVPISQVQ